MKGLRKIKLQMLSGLIMLILLLSYATAVPAQEDINANRLAGADRILTAEEVSKAGWSRADTVLLARSDNYADALAGVPLAHQLGAPILLTPSSWLHSETLKEINRLNASNVIVLGGYNAMSENIVAELRLTGLSVERIGGTNRFKTAAQIAYRINNDSHTAVVVYSNDFKDALVASPYAARMGYPVLLTATNYLPEATEEIITDLAITKTIIVGNNDMVSSKVMSLLPNPVRVGIPYHHSNSVAAANFFGLENDRIFIATSKDFADAITGAVLAAKYDSGVFLVGDTVPPEVSDYLRSGIALATIFGGPNAVSVANEKEIQAACSGFVPASEIILSDHSIEIGVGEQHHLQANVLPTNSTERSVVWSSTNADVADVDEMGVVTAYSAGTISITATTYSGSISASCTVTVKENGLVPITGIKLLPSNLSLDVGQSSQLAVAVEPEKATSPSVSWHSSNPAIASVDSSGYVTANSSGNATISVHTSDGLYSAACAVTVTIPPAVLDDGIYHMVNKSSGLFLNAYSDKASKAPWKVVGAIEDGTPEQKFKIERQGDGSYLFTCQAYGANKKLTLSSNAGSGTQLHISSDNISTSQRFYIYSKGNGAYTISPASAKNPNLVVGESSIYPYSAPLLHLTTYSGTQEHWEIRMVPAYTGPIFPVDLSVGGWDALTYFGGHEGTEYSAIDLNRNSPYHNTDKGAAVRAVQDGVVVNIISSHGQVHIRHTVPLVLKNGRTYNTWYTASIHMDTSVKVGDRVTQGQIIGYVGKAGASTEHLHFSIQTKLTSYNSSSSSSSYQPYAISPYWIGGAYDRIVYRSAYAEEINTKIKRSINQAPPAN